MGDLEEEVAEEANAIQPNFCSLADDSCYSIFFHTKLWNGSKGFRLYGKKTGGPLKSLGLKVHCTRMYGSWKMGGIEQRQCWRGWDPWNPLERSSTVCFIFLYSEPSVQGISRDLPFLVATKRLYKSVCPSVGRSVRWSVCHAFGHARY